MNKINVDYLVINKNVRGKIKYIKEVAGIDKSKNNGFSIKGVFTKVMYDPTKIHLIETEIDGLKDERFIIKTYYLMFFVDNLPVFEKIGEIKLRYKLDYATHEYTQVNRNDIYPLIWDAIEKHLL